MRTEDTDEGIDDNEDNVINENVEGRKKFSDI